MKRNEHIVNNTKEFIKTELANAESGHDWWHAIRVYNNAISIAKTENCDMLTVQLASLLHDIADSKFYNGDENAGPNKAEKFLINENIDKDIISHIIKIIRNISFKGGNSKQNFKSIETDIVQDADRLDAIGAIGIARAFSYGGYKRREFYNPEIKPNLNMSPEEYKKSNAPTINHFYEKLLQLKDRMNTKKGKELAEDRHQFLLCYLDQFYKEWDGDNSLINNF